MIALQLTLVQLRLHYPELFIDVYLDETKCEQGIGVEKKVHEQIYKCVY